MTITSYKQPVLDMLHGLFSQISKPDLFQKMRQKAWEAFLEKGLPDKKLDAYRYLPLSSFYTQPFQSGNKDEIPSQSDILSHVFQECQNAYIVLIDGVFYPDLSNLSALPKGVVVLPLEKAFSTYGSFLQSRYMKAVQEEQDAFALLNMALIQSGVFIYVPPKTIVNQVIQLVHISTSFKDDVFTNSRAQIFLGAHAELKVIATSASKKPLSRWRLNCLDVAQDDGAQFHYNNLVFTEDKEWVFDYVRASVKRDASLQGLTITNGSKSVRFDQKVELNSENAEVNLEGLWMLDGHKQAHHYITVRHLAPYTRSQQYFKGLVDDFSQSSFEGKIYVQDIAQKTEAYQLNQNLVLGERAIANSKPNLEIFADDVKASHGATVSQLNEEEMFYLKSRGLSAEQARSLLVTGFCKELVDKIFVEEAKQSVLSFTQRYLNKTK